MLQWSEQMCKLDVASADHHGKRFSRMVQAGEKLLNWRYTVMNEIGQVVIAVNVESCSYRRLLLESSPPHPTPQI